MTDICSFNSTCPCFDETRCAKTDPDADCIVRLIDIYKNLYNAHQKVLSDQINLLGQQCTIQNSINDYFQSLKRPFSVSAIWYPNCSPWGR